MLEINLSLSYRFSEPSDLTNVIHLLEVLHLPVEGVTDQFENYLLLFSSSELIGCAGLEIYDQFGLLRSVAIKPEFQNKHLGSIMVQKLEELGKSKNITEFYLLTETAKNFFTKHNYKVVSRELVPNEIQNSYEYSTACKISAIVMKKIL